MNPKTKESTKESPNPRSALSGLITGLCQVRKEKASLDKAEKAILAELKPLVDPKFDTLPEQPIVGDGLELTRSSGTSRTISAELLLERGVSPDLIQYATKTTTYFRYLVKEQK